jgi:two-component system, chemotaxis family, sensor kinase CheA
MDDLLTEFLTETTENLNVLDVELVKLEQDPNNSEILSNIFRLMHTIKGTSGFLGLPRLEAVAHAGENILGKVRDGELIVTPQVISLVLESVDTIKAILVALEQAGKEPAGNDQDLIKRLNAMADGAKAAPVSAPEPEAMAEPEEAQETEYAEDVAEAHPPAPSVPAAAKSPAKIDGKPSEIKAAKDTDADAKSGSSVADQSIRVSVDLLENLMTTVSELVLTRNQLLQIARNHKDSEFNVPIQQLSNITSELQEGVMKTRMQPIGNAWGKLPRIIRDLARELNKKIDLQMIGAETELDRQVLELIKDPLTHMVRNSADHGVEMPAERLAAGKSETGKVVLNAFHEGGHIIIQISDDGKGLDTVKIRQKIVQNGLGSQDDVNAMTDQQVQQYIFKAGFSTAAKVTSVSGRGVGMDVVRTNIEKIGGTIEMNSVLGKGTTFTIKIPLTLAIVSALIVGVANERYAVPQISVVELVRASANSEYKIEMIKGTPVLRLRNKLLPLVPLDSMLRLNSDQERNQEDDYVIVVQVANFQFGIVVDSVFDTEEIVVKPVASILRDIPLFSGNTILGDGTVIMILDPNGIAAAASNNTLTDNAEDAAVDRVIGGGQETTTLLVFRAGDEAPKAVPLSLVARLEEIKTDTIEFSHGKPVVQYRGKLMPLVPINADYKIRTGTQPLIVFTDSGRSMGLMVDEIVDIVENSVNIEINAVGEGYIGGAIIAGKATNIIDTAHFLTYAFGDWFSKKGHNDDAAALTSRRVLLIDDSAFFRNLIVPMLSVEGYSVTAVDSAAAALALRDKNRSFDLIITDIEMPDTDGFTLTEQLRRDGQWKNLPIIALSAHTGAAELQRGRECGLTDFVPKLDREILLSTLKQSLSMGEAA